jgi:ferritin-like metal-binding protein YciE
MIFSKRFVHSKIFIMETMINLKDLLKHEIMDLYSAEEQIIEALPGMIDKAKNPELKKALREHLRITEEQKNRLDKIKQSFGEGEADGEEGGEKKGFFSRLFGGGGEKCKGMEGLITEGEKIMKADIDEEALDAAIIASAQKIEHYEICGYGTARAFARELQLADVERLLTQTLNEEYTSDNLLTELAVGKLNLKAENATGEVDADMGRSGRMNRLAGGSNSTNGSSSKGGNNSGRSASSKSGSKSSASKGTKSSGNGISKSGGSSNRNASKAKSSKGNSKSGSSKGNSKNSGSSKGSSKSGSSKAGSKSAGSSSRGNSKSSAKSSRPGGSKGSKSSSKSSSKGNSRKR